MLFIIELADLSSDNAQCYMVRPLVFVKIISKYQAKEKRKSDQFLHRSQTLFLSSRIFMVMHIYNEHIYVAREWLASASHSTSLHHSDFPCKINVPNNAHNNCSEQLPVGVVCTYRGVPHLWQQCILYMCNILFLSQCMGGSKRPIGCYKKYIQGVIKYNTHSGFGVRRLACIRAFY